MGGRYSMKCRKCGYEVNEDAQFCQQCGAKIEKYFFWDIEVEFNFETMEKSKIIQRKKIFLDSEEMVEELKKAEAQIISLYSSMNIDDVNSIHNIRDQIEKISKKYNIASTIVEELNYRLRKIVGIHEEAQTEKQETDRKGKVEKGIFVEGSFDTLKCLLEKKKKYATWELPVFIIWAIILIWEGKFLIKEGMNSIGSKWVMFGTLLDFLMFIFLDFIIACIIWKIVKPLIIKKTNAISKACCELITVNDIQALYEAVKLLKMKNVFYDEHGNVCIEGKIGTHILKVEKQKLVMLLSNDLDMALETNTISTSLLKQLDYQSPINAYEKERGNRSLMKVDVKLKVAITLSFLLLAGGILIQHEWLYIDLVQTCCPKQFSDISYKEAFKEYFSDGKWKHLKHFDWIDDDNVVEFDGKGIYDGKESEIKIQFIVTEKEDDLYNIEMGAALVDGEQLNSVDEYTYIFSIFEQYESKQTK